MIRTPHPNILMFVGGFSMCASPWALDVGYQYSSYIWGAVIFSAGYIAAYIRNARETE